MYSKSSTKPLVTDAMKERARYILLIALCLLLRPGVAEAVKVELDAGSSSSSVSTTVTAYSIVRHESLEDELFEDSDSWSDSGIQYEGLADAYQAIQTSYCGSSVAASVSVSSGARSASPEPGEQSIEGQELYDIRFSVDCTSWPCPAPGPEYFTILAGYDCQLEAVGSIVWELLPSTEDEEIGTPVIVSFRQGYSAGGLSGGTVYQFHIYDWEYGVMGQEMEGPYAIANYADPPTYGATPEPDWEDLTIHASIGDTIKLSYKMEGYAYTQDSLVPSNLNSDEEYPTMGLSVGVWVEPLFLPDLIGEFSVTGFRYPPDPGATLQAEVELLVTNIGVTATKPKEDIDLEFFLRPIDALDDSEDILVSTLYNISIGKLAPGRSKRMALSVPISIPAFTDGIFIFGVVYVDSSNDVIESDEGNNTAITTDCVIIVSSGVPLMRPDLTGEFSQIRFRGSPTPGATGRAKIDISNIGTKETEIKQVIDIEIRLRSYGVPSQDITLLTLRDQSVSKLRPSRSKTFRATFELPAGLVVGEYQLVAKIDSSEAVEELNEENNEVLSAVFEVVTK